MTRRLSSANEGRRFPDLVSEAKAPPSRTCERLQNKVLQNQGAVLEKVLATLSLEKGMLFVIARQKTALVVVLATSYITISLEPNDKLDVLKSSIILTDLVV